MHYHTENDDFTSYIGAIILIGAHEPLIVFSD
jgi:hypothetical protein